MTAHWRYLVMVSWPIDPARLADWVPRGIELDYFQGRTFVSLVAFLFRETRVRGLAIPFHRHFAEVNLRYYVRREVSGELRRGVMFVKEIVPLPAVTWVARGLYHENYVTLRMRHQCPAGQAIRTGDRFRYEWRYRRRWNVLQGIAGGHLYVPPAGTLDQFIAEHYWGYSTNSRGQVIEYEVRHPSWPVAELSTLELDGNLGQLYGGEFAECFQTEPASAFVADGSPVEIFPGDMLPANA
jgi:uncharacterized protein YqjF (DUF2071 family)